MVNNSTNIIKENNHLSLQVIEYEKNPPHSICMSWYDVGTPGFVLKQAHICGKDIL
jgi:hypothetical protein